MQAAPKRCSNGTVTSSVYTEDEQGRMNCSPDAHLPSLPVLRRLWCFKLVTSAAIIKYHSHFFWQRFSIRSITHQNGLIESGHVVLVCAAPMALQCSGDESVGFVSVQLCKSPILWNWLISMPCASVRVNCQIKSFSQIFIILCV